MAQKKERSRIRTSQRAGPVQRSEGQGHMRWAEAGAEREGGCGRIRGAAAKHEGLGRTRGGGLDRQDRETEQEKIVFMYAQQPNEPGWERIKEKVGV